MYIQRKVGEKGQVVIPEQIRREAGIMAGSTVRFDYREGLIVVEPEKTDSERLKEFCNVIPPEKRRRFDIDKVFGQSYEERSGKRRNR